MIAMNFAQGFACGGIQQVHQVGIIFLLEMMQSFPDQPVGIELAAKCAQLAAVSRAEQRIRHGLRAAKSSNDTAHGGNFHLRGGVTYQENSAVAHAALDRNPLAVNRNARALPFERLNVFLFQETFDALFRFLTTAFANDAKRAPRFVFRNEPIEVWSVIGNEP